MKNLKEELKKLTYKNLEGALKQLACERLKEELKQLTYENEIDDDHRLFIDETVLDKFACEHDLCIEDDSGYFDQTKVENACDCKLVYDYEGANPNRFFNDYQVIFNDHRSIFY